MKPMISVIIPTLNEEKYIGMTLNALKNQDYKGGYEIIVADGMSKDKTVEIAKKYADKIIQVKKRGIAVGRNAGARIAKGEILVFVDADTILLFNALKEVSKAFRRKKVVGAACPAIPLSSKARDFAIYWSLNEFVKRSIKLKTPQIPGFFCAYRKEAFEEVNGFDERLKVLEDYDLSKRISKLGEIVFLDNTLVLTSQRRIEKWGRMKAIRKYLKIYFSYLLKGKNFKINDYRPIR